MTTTKINPREKREELLTLWERMFKLCEAQVTKMEAGTLDLTASMLKELNAFMKQSAATLVELEKAQELDEAKCLLEAAVEPPVEPQDDPEEDDDVMPFPVASSAGVGSEAAVGGAVEAPQVEPLAVPLEY